MSKQPPAWAIDAARAAHKVCLVALASFGLAQAAAESAWFTRVSGRNNFHGIKALKGQACTTVTTHETLNGRSHVVQCAFRDFATPAESFMAHARILATAASCAAFRAALPDLARAADALGGGTPLHPRYATAVNYGSLILGIIRGSDLVRFDV